MTGDPSLLAIGAEVRQALEAGRPVVALESTIVTHGMPYPENLATARDVEAVVRAHGAVPATIAVVAGRLTVGLEDRALAALARDEAVAKASGRDLAAILARGGSAGTTVAATMQIAAMAGIAVFATGGVGGVHRGAETSFDVSADLTELGRTGVVVVCAGVKSILDIGKTLEVLETQRVPVWGWRTRDFPAFFTRTSGHKVDHAFDDLATLAAAIHLHRRLGSGTGIMVANPLPEADALDPAFIDGVIADAVGEAEAGGIVGKALTPFLLARINTLSEGRSLAANIALIRANAALAAGIAGALLA
jgi:pseudouridine-5'-phosphate glycosidase